MTTMWKSALILVGVAFFMSCAGNDDIEEQIAAFREETIVLPDLVKVEHREISEGKPAASEQLWMLFKEVLANLEANGGVYVEPEER